MAHPRMTPGVLPSHRALQHDVRDGVAMTLHTFEANARHRTDAADGIVTIRVLSGRLQVIGRAGLEAWAVGARELVVLRGTGPYEIIATTPSDVWIAVHHGVPRGPQLVLA